MTGARPSLGSSRMRKSRVRDERASDREHLLLAAAQRHAGIIAALPQDREQLVNERERPASVAPCRATEQQVLLDGQVRQDAPALQALLAGATLAAESDGKDRANGHAGG